MGLQVVLLQRTTGLAIPDDGDLRDEVRDGSNWKANREYGRIA